MTDFLANQLNSGADSPIAAVNKNIGSLTDEEKKQPESELAIEAKRLTPHTGQHTSDVASAREAEVRTRESEQAGWLEKNVHSLLAFCIMFITFTLYIVVIYASTRPDFKNAEAKDIVIYILGALTTVATQVVSYYFGSSSGSADKSKTINAISRR